MDFSRLTLEQIKNLDLAKILMTMEDTNDIVDILNGRLLIPHFHLFNGQKRKVSLLLKELPLFWPILMHGY